MKKLLVLLLTLLALTVVFAACSCGGEGEPADTTAPADESTESQPESESVGPDESTTTPESSTAPESSSTPESSSEPTPAVDPTPATVVPSVADKDFEANNDTVYAFPNESGIYNKGNRVNYYSLPYINEADKGHVLKGSYADGTQFKRVGIYYETAEKTVGWSKIELEKDNYIYIRNSVLVKDHAAAVAAAGTANSKIVTTFETVDEYVYVIPKNAENDHYVPGGKVSYYTAAAKDFTNDGGDYHGGEYVDGKKLHRVGVYYEDAKKELGWSKIALENGNFVYIRNWCLTTDENYKTTAQQ